MRDVILIVLFLLLWVLFVPTPGVDCSHYTGKTFHGVTVNCDQAVRK